MPRFEYINWAVDANGDIIANAEFEVRRKSDGALETLYTAETGGSTIANPGTTDVDGRFVFWAEQDDYDITAGAGASQAVGEAKIDSALRSLNFGERAEAVDWIGAGHSIPDGVKFHAAGVSYISLAAASGISDMAGVLPFGDVTAEHFGGKPGRSNSAATTTALNEAANYCRLTGRRLRLLEGSYFANDTLDLSGIKVVGEGVGQVPTRSAFYHTSFEGLTPAKSQIVLTGSSFTPTNAYGVSSMQACGAARVFGNPRANHNETDWLMSSLMNADATTGEATPKDLKVGILLDGRAASNLSGFRVVIDGGGDDGLDDYNDDTISDLIGNVDIGILQVGGRSTELSEVQAVGHYRVAGYYNLSKPLALPFGDFTLPYETTINRCLFQGFRAAAVRGPDKFKILAETSTTVDLPWADDHPFTTDADQNIIRPAELGPGTSAGTVYTYSGVSKVDLGGGDVRIRLSGLSSFNSGGFGAVIPSRNVGANSHIVFNGCQFGGLQLPSGYNPNDTANAASPLNNGAIGGVELSGYASAETAFNACRIQHQGSVALFAHEAREVVLDFLTEGVGNRSNGDFGLRYIVSPQQNNNPHADNPVGGVRWIQWDYNLVLEYSSSTVDFSPFIKAVPRPALYSGDDGWFEAYWGTRPMMVRAYTPAGRYEAGVERLKVGDDAEGLNGFFPDGDLHVRRSGAGTNVIVESTENENDPAIFLESERRQAQIRVSDAGAEFRILWDGNKDGNYDEIAVYSAVTGWEFRGAVAFNAGFGSIAEAFGVRSWAQFDNTGSISQSGNVASVVRNGPGNYTVTFNNIMPDNNYSVPVSCSNGPFRNAQTQNLAQGSFDIQIYDETGAATDAGVIHFHVVR